MRLSGAVPVLDRERVLIYAQACHARTVLGDYGNQQIVQRHSRLRIDQRFAEMRRAACRADGGKIRSGDPALAVNRMAAGTVSFTALELRPLGPVSRQA